jgi:hypothetical protein
MLGKTFKGLTDNMLRSLTKNLLALETDRDQYTVYVKPELVVEIAYGDIQESPRYPGGLALRFARVKRLRRDKSSAEADTIQIVWSVFNGTLGRNNCVDSVHLLTSSLIESDCTGESYPYLSVYHQIGDAIETRGVPVENDEPSPVPLCKLRETRGWIDDKGGSNGKK